MFLDSLVWPMFETLALFLDVWLARGCSKDYHFECKAKLATKLVLSSVVGCQVVSRMK